MYSNSRRYTPSYGNGTPVIEKKGSEEASVTTYTENNYQNTKTYENNSNLIQKDYTYNGYSNQPIGRQISQPNLLVKTDTYSSPTKIEYFNDSVKLVNQIKDQNFSWLSHFYILLSSSYDNNVRSKCPKILSLIKDNVNKFSKVIIYAEDADSSRQILKVLTENLKWDIKIIKNSHTQQQTRSIFIQFAIPQIRILITTKPPSQLNQEGMINVEDVNMIIFQSLPLNSQQYKKKLIRSPNLNKGAKGVAICFTTKDYNRQLFKYIPNLYQHQNNLNIKFEEWNNRVDLNQYIKKEQQKIQTKPILPMKKDNYITRTDNLSINNNRSQLNNNGRQIEQHKKQSLLKEVQQKQKTKNKFKVSQSTKKQESTLRPSSRRNDNTKYLIKIQQQSNDSNLKDSGLNIQKLTTNKLFKVEQYLQRNQKFLQIISTSLNQVSQNTKNVKQFPQQTAELIQIKLKTLENTLGDKTTQGFSKQITQVKNLINMKQKQVIQKIQKVGQTIINKNDTKQKQGKDNKTLKKSQFTTQIKSLQKNIQRNIEDANQKNLLQKIIMMIEKVDKDVDKLQNSQSNQNLNNDNLKKQYQQIIKQKQREIKKIRDGYQNLDQEKGQIIKKYEQLLKDKDREIKRIKDDYQNVYQIRIKTKIQYEQTIKQKEREIKTVRQQNLKLKNQNQTLKKELERVNNQMKRIKQQSDQIIQLLTKQAQSDYLMIPKLMQVLNNSHNSLNKSYIYIQLLEQNQKQFLEQTIKSIVGIKIKKTIALTQMNRNTDVNNCQTWLEKLYRKNNMLMMVVLDNDQVLASFNSDYFLPQNSKTMLNNGSGVIMNLTNMKRYYLKKCFKGKGIKKDQKYFILGNNQLVIKPNFKIEIMISGPNCYYETAQVTNSSFFGYEADECGYKCLEFFQILLK